MKTIGKEKITRAVSALITDCLYRVEASACALLARAEKNETAELSKWALQKILENNEIATTTRTPACQDCGQAVLFVSAGQDLLIDGDLKDALNEGVRQGYAAARKSVCDPLTRKNTETNAPAVIYFDITSGEGLEIAVLLKGAGAENMSRLFMLTPAQGLDGIVAAAVQTVEDAGSNPCPPIVVGIGIGGTADLCTVLSKKALLRKTGTPAADKKTADLEQEILQKINALQIGAQGFGGNTTALAVHIETAPTHIGMLPVAVCVQCHCVRHGRVTL